MNPSDGIRSSSSRTADRNPIRYISRGFSGSISSIEVFLVPRWGHVQQKGPRNARTKETPFASRGFDGTPQRSPMGMGDDLPNNQQSHRGNQ